MATQTRTNNGRSPDAGTSSGEGYVLPVVHATLPKSFVNAAFWAGLAGAAVVGAVEFPLVALVGAGVVIARHGRKS